MLLDLRKAADGREMGKIGVSPSLNLYILGKQLHVLHAG